MKVTRIEIKSTETITDSLCTTIKQLIEHGLNKEIMSDPEILSPNSVRINLDQPESAGQAISAVEFLVGLASLISLEYEGGRVIAPSRTGIDLEKFWRDFRVASFVPKITKAELLYNTKAMTESERKLQIAEKSDEILATDGVVGGSFVVDTDKVLKTEPSSIMSTHIRKTGVICSDSLIADLTVSFNSAKELYEAAGKLDCEVLSFIAGESTWDNK